MGSPYFHAGIPLFLKVALNDCKTKNHNVFSNAAERNNIATIRTAAVLLFIPPSLSHSLSQPNNMF